jgi:hypothetical protein
MKNFGAYAMYINVYAEFLLWYMLWLLSSEIPRLDSRRVLRCLFFVPCFSYAY